MPLYAFTVSLSIILNLTLVELILGQNLREPGDTTRRLLGVVSLLFAVLFYLSPL